jgi:hypothetical protein
MFTVVKFTSDKSVQLVPTNWISQDKLQCKWPPLPNHKVTPLILKQADPLESWKKIPIKVYKSCGKS